MGSNKYFPQKDHKHSNNFPFLQCVLSTECGADSVLQGRLSEAVGTRAALSVKRMVLVCTSVDQTYDDVHKTKISN